MLSLLPDELRMFMGMDSIDNERAQFMLDQVMLLCQAIVDPVPDTAAPVVLSAASRAYASPPGNVTSEMVGPYQATRSAAGAYLTRSERSSLRRLSGGGGAFSVDLLPAGYPDSAFQ